MCAYCSSPVSTKGPRGVTDRMSRTCKISATYSLLAHITQEGSTYPESVCQCLSSRRSLRRSCSHLQPEWRQIHQLQAGFGLPLFLTSRRVSGRTLARNGLNPSLDEGSWGSFTTYILEIRKDHIYWSPNGLEEAHCLHHELVLVRRHVGL